MATKPNQSAIKLFTVLDVLWRNFATGYTRVILPRQPD